MVQEVWNSGGESFRRRRRLGSGQEDFQKPFFLLVLSTPFHGGDQDYLGADPQDLLQIVFGISDGLQAADVDAPRQGNQVVVKK